VSSDNSNDLPAEGGEEVLTEEMLWERIPSVEGVERANTYYELSARIYARGQYDEALALAETAKDLFLKDGDNSEGLAQAYSAMGYNLNQLKRIDEAAAAMSMAVDILRQNKSALALDLSVTLGEWLFSSKEYGKTIEIFEKCLPEHLIDGDNQGAANDLYLIALSQIELNDFEKAFPTIEKAINLFKEEKDVVSVGRCDHKLAKIMNGLSRYDDAIGYAQKALDIFLTSRDQGREIYARWEMSKALSGIQDFEKSLDQLERILDLLLEEEPRDFEFIVEVEERISQVLIKLDKIDESNEIANRIKTIKDILRD
jgi:tetratricopeptide (TPR) repeat protein